MSVFAKATASRSARAAWTGIAIAGVSALLLTACSTGGTPAPAESEEPADTGDALEIEAGERDLTLKVGTILPQSGTLAFLGPPEEAGVALAAQEINEADAGIQVEVVYRDSGDTTTDIATVSVTDLLSQDVSAIIGAASSGVSFTVIDQITAAGVVQFSPANTSPDFTDYEDNGLYFRTAPSDLLQGEVLGNLIAEDGASTLGLLVLNDPYGTGLAAATKESFEAAGGEVVAEELFNTGDSNFDAQLSSINAANPDAVAVITFDEAKVVVPALVGSGYPGDQLYFVESGTLVVLSGQAGAAREIARIGPGEFFGELALLGDGQRTATVRAETDARLWALPAEDCHELRARAELTAARLNAIPGMACVAPQGAFYAMPRVELPAGRSDEDFVLALLRETGILCVYGSGFGTNPNDGFFRVVFLASLGELGTIYDDIAAFTGKYLQG